MGAGSSSEQRSPEQPEAGSAAAPAEPQAGGGAPEPEAAPSSPGDPEIHAAGDPSAKVFQKNGQLSAVGSLTEQGELSLQEGALDGQEDMVIVKDVGQRGSEDVSERASVKDMAANPPEAQDPPKDGLEETPEILEQASPSKGNQEEEPAPAPESQTSDVGFKKVFKFVGLKFTVRRDKNDKSDAVQLLTLKKEDSEAMTEGSQGAGDHPEPSPAAGEAASKEDELRQSTEKPPETSPQGPASLPEEPEQPAEGGREEAGEKTEKEPPKPVESPTSPQASETASPFRKFFTQGWAGWRKKTSFRKPKDEELEVSEKKEPEAKTAEQQREGNEGPDASEKPPGAANEARLSAEYEKVELPADEAGEGPPRERTAPLATEVFDEKVETVAEVHVSPEEQSHEGEGAVGSRERPQAQVETDKEPQRAEPAEKEDQQQEEEKTLEASTSGGDLSQGPEFSPSEGVLSEAELLASQERTRPQGSPLKKLFSSSGLKKLSSKKQKSRRAGAEEETGERPLESPDSPAEEQKGDSSASSPEEPEEPTVLEKATAEGARDPEAQEGPVSSSSEGEKKREGSTPWASFKKMVTPKKRARRPSDSDREDDLDKVKSATLSSAESATSDLLETETRGGTEEPKRRVDTSVSWEALICVGSSKKRARKASSSDEDEGPKATVSGEGQKPDEAAEKDRDTVTAETQAAAAASQEPDAGTGGSSPEQAGTPSEGEGISTWESFKRLVTPRKRAKAKVEEKHEEPTPGSAGLEPPAATEGEAAGSGREESWVSIKKLIPGRKKKRPEGKPEQAPAGGGPEEDSEDVPAVVPLSEFDAAEREKAEARGASPSEQEEAGPVHVSEEASQSLVHTVRVTVVDGAKAVSDLEERSPSWISASVPGPLEQDATVVAETARGAEAAATALPESRDVSRDTLASEVEVTSEAVTAAETTGASGAEETTDMVSAVSQLTESPATTEEATPVQEAEGGPVDGAELERRTQAVLLAVVEKVSSEALPGGPGDPTPEGTEKAESGRWAGDDNKEEGVFSQELDSGIQTETLTLSEAAPEGPPGKECRESAELRTPHPAGENAAVVGAKSEVVLEQGTAAPDSSETLTDSETNESSPVTEFEAVGSVQQDGVVDSPKDDEAVASASKSKAPEGEAAPARSEMSPVAPCGLPSSGEGKDHLEPEEVLEHRHGETTVEPAPALSKMVLESRPDAREKGQETAGAREQERSADGAGQEALPAAALPEGAAGEAEGEGSDLQSQPGEPVGGVEQAEAEPGQTPALAAGSRERGHVKVTFTEDAEEGLSLEEIPSRVQEEAAGTEIQSPGLSPAAVAGDKAGGESVESLETPEHLESAPSAQAERVEDGPVQSEERAGASGTESRAASEEDLIPEPEGDGIQARAAARERTRKTEGQSLLFEAQSNKLVQDVIQAVVEQLVSGEGTSTEALQGPGPPARGKESALQAEEESRAVAEAEEQAASDVSREESEASEKLTPSEVVQGPSVNDQQVEEAGEAARAESGLQGGGGSVGAEVVACSEHPNPAPEDSETSGGFTKESPDANGPKLTEEEGRREEEFLTGKAEGNQSEKELKMGAPVETSQPAEN